MLLRHVLLSHLLMLTLVSCQADGEIGSTPDTPEIAPGPSASLDSTEASGTSQPLASASFASSNPEDAPAAMPTQTLAAATAQDATPRSVPRDRDPRTRIHAAADSAALNTSLDLKVRATLGEAAVPVVQADGTTYTVSLHALPGHTVVSTLSAQVASNESDPTNIHIEAGSTASLSITAITPTLYVDAPTAYVAVQARDSRGASVKPGTTVTAEFVDPSNNLSTASCETSENGACMINWEAAEALFSSGGTVQVHATADSTITSLDIALSPAASPDPLTQPGASINLPDSPRFPGESFDVPVYLETPGLEAGAYDVEMEFDPSQLVVSAVFPGSCLGFAFPIHNAGTEAADEGVLKINGINSLQPMTCLDEAQVHVATVRFTVPETVSSPAEPAPIACTIAGLYSIHFADLGSGNDCEVHGQVQIQPNTVVGLAAAADDVELLNWAPITGEAQSTDLRITAYMANGEEFAVTTADGVQIEALDPDIVVVASDRVFAGSTPGTTALSISYAGVTTSLPLHVRTIADIQLSVSDTKLQPIAGTNSRQWGQVSARITWTDGATALWTQDITDLLADEQWVASPSLSFDLETYQVHGATAGFHTLRIDSPDGSTLASTLVEVESTPVQVSAITASAPCSLLIGNPSTDSSGTTWADILVESRSALGAACQVQAFAHFEDGTRLDLVGHPGLEITSLTPGLMSSTNSGQITGLSEGLATIEARWFLDGATLGVSTASVEITP